MSQHSFDISIAKEYGIESAIILQNLSFWVEKNKANNVHFHDGAYWTYNSIKAFNELFPYMSESTIRRTLKNLEGKGIIKTGNYNRVGYDRTTWYAITEKGFCILNKSICHFEQIDLSKSENGFSQNGEPIPDIKPVNKRSSKTDSRGSVETYAEIESAYLSAFKEVIPNGEPILDYAAIRKRQKTVLSKLPKEKVLLAIERAKKDSWIVENGFSLMTILGDYQMNKLLNGTQQARPSGPPLRVQSRTTCLDLGDD